MSEIYIDPRVKQPPPPGEESAGYPLTPLVTELKAQRQILDKLHARALSEMQCRTAIIRASNNTDAGTGDAVLELYEVPPGYIGYLVHLQVDEAGVTPAAPDTNANLWLGIYGGEQSGQTTQAQVVAIGALLDALPDRPTAAGGFDGQIPATFRYGDYRCAPTLKGGSVFYLVIDAATASRQVYARGTVYLERQND